MIAALKRWTSSNKWKQLKQINNLLRKKLKGGWKPEDAFYHSMENLVSSSFLFNIKVYGFITLPVVLNGRETWSLTLREECGLRMFENSV